MDNKSKIICRKCGGNHLAIKCGKTASNILIEEEKKSYSKKEGEGEGEKKPYSKKEGEGEKKPYSKKEGEGEGEKKPYSKKEGEGEGEKKPYFKKEGDDGEKKPYYKKEDDGEKKPYYKKEGDGEKKPYFKREGEVNKVRISSLPLDMTEEELNELLYDWGTVKHLRLLQYPAYGSSTAYVEFRYADEVDYLVKALDRTPFEHRMITVEKLDN